MKTIEDLKKIREETRAAIYGGSGDDSDTVRVVVGMATCGIAAGARPVLDACRDEARRRNLKDITITQTGCVGVCRLEPIVEVYAPGQERVTYVKMTPEKARKVIAEHIVNKRAVKEYTIWAEA